MGLSQQTLRAVRRYGPGVDGLARHRYGISGEALLAKLVLGESGDRMGAVSSAGARGKAQFTAGSRATAIRRFGIDPWRSTDEAVHAAVLHLRGKINGSKGLEGYNPGDPSYPHYILSRKVGNVGQGSTGGGGASMQNPAYSATPATELPAGSRGLTDLVASQLQHPAVMASAPAEPAFSARASLKLPTGFQTPPSGGGPAPRTSLQDAIQALAQQDGSGSGLSPLGQPVTNQAPGGSTSQGGLGRAVLEPGADRPGVRTHGDILRFARQAAGIDGSTFKIGTGSNHNQFTVNGTVSDHWRGEGVDVLKRGRALVRAGQAALIAAGMPEAKARRQTGGGFNVGHWQIIFNTNAPGWGDHTTHLHIGRRR